MLRVALAFLLGDVWVQLLPDLAIDRLLKHALLLVAAALVCLAWPQLRRSLSIAAIVAFLLGFVCTVVPARSQLDQDLPLSFAGEDVLVTGYVASIPEHEPYGVRFVFAVEQALPQIPRRIELTSYQPTVSMHAAERWQLQVRLKRRHGYANPGGYDYEAQLFRQGLGATGYIRESRQNQLLGMAAHQGVLRARATIAEAIARAIPDAPMQGVIRGLAVGDQQAITSDEWRVFARTGTSHLMAISGFHIGMVAWLFAWLGSRLIHLPLAQRWRWTAPDLRALFGMSAALGYSLLAGMSVPTQRTLIMLAVYFGAGLLRREVNIWHSFGLALLWVLLLDPFAPLAVGAWLSFGAVAIILLNQVGRIGKAAWWREFLNVQGVVSLGLAPLLLSAFGGLSLVSPWVNLLAIPLFTAVLVPLVLIGCGILMVHPAGGAAWLGWVAQLLDRVFAGLQWAAQLPWASWYAPQAGDWAMALLVLGAVMIIVPWSWPLRLSGALWCLPALTWQTPAPPMQGFTLTALDVGQGLALVVRTQHHTLLYDAGPRFQSGRDTGELVVLPYLHALGIRHLDMVMASHGDDDHVGGLASVLAGMQVDRLLMGPSVKPMAAATRCQRGQQWRWDGVLFSVLNPDRDSAAVNSPRSDNDSSCVLAISAASGRALLLGDIEQQVERELVRADLIEASDVVVAAHHGSRSSSTQQLVAASRPQWVIFSAGYRNRWGFPKQEVVARWQSVGASAAVTSEAGAITVAFAAQQPMQVQGYRQQRRRYWQNR